MMEPFQKRRAECLCSGCLLSENLFYLRYLNAHWAFCDKEY